MSTKEYGIAPLLNMRMTYKYTLIAHQQQLMTALRKYNNALEFGNIDSVIADGCAIPFTNLVKSLGIFVSPSLDWYEQITNICNRAYKTLYQLKIRTGKNQPMLQKTKLGWIIGGPYTTENQQDTIREFCGFSETRNLQDQLQRFWKIEELQTTQALSQEEWSCERHFVQTHKRLPSGRFEVRLPCRNDPSKLGESYAFMCEYENLEHMSIVKEDSDFKTKNYLPHHAVMDEEKETTKLRVVFEASSSTTSGKSLNDILIVGPVIQRELMDIVTRFRQHEYLLIADITKMYRQVSVNPEDRDLQRIFWRNDVNAPPTKRKLRASSFPPIGDCNIARPPKAGYCLNTLTYSTGPASFLATRCLAQLAIENAAKFPEASKIIKEDFYMDDLITGGSSVTELCRHREEIKEILESASFP
ncbi:uncharacterized protein LOC107273145 [Cephus cinctus]|uniref:Uncharacterized protein LOC107273145 n=1 Tax=Cephus cinctus TaxID=211228 RepID=A0AAJ7FSU6_CEPCN|nr:uncharacterized protein LOC107273145 [Cephus cinctus]